jgi:hypothetical protein
MGVRFAGSAAWYLLAPVLWALAPAVVLATTDTWDGGGADNFLSTGANWADNTAPLSSLVNTDVVFAGNTRLTPFLGLSFSTNSVTFNNTAGAFSIGGNTLNVGTGGITNNDADTETFTNAVSFGGVANSTINAASGDLTFTGTVTLTVASSLAANTARPISRLK